MYIRHGDVLLRPVSKIPSGKEIQHSGEIIIAEGEATGHAHRLKSKEAKAVEADGVLYLSLTVPAPLTHEEHKEIVIPAGDYERVFEREFDYALDSIYQVQD